MINNPFEIKTPEQNSAEDILELFVDVFSDFWQVKNNEHTFLNGPRGSGKSMMFRYMLPDCQMLKNKCEAKDLPYFSVYVGIKQTNINNTDLERLANHASIIFNEHLLSTFVVANVFHSILTVFGEKLNTYTDEIASFFSNSFCQYVQMSGYTGDLKRETTGLNGKELFIKMISIVEVMLHECQQYCKRITLNKDITLPYNGALTDFVDFVEPLIKSLKKITLFPQDKPFFILIDDAGYLNLPQTKVLNTWVSYRSTKDICLKISTQLDYKTHLTSNDKRIDAPHDYSEINISTVYSSKTSKYNERIQEIVKKRIEKYLKIEIDPRTFFPEYEKQKKALEEIYNSLYEKHRDSSRSYAAGDAARRYASSEYMKSLQREHKSAAHYNYAGFDQLVAISSGIIRHFLAPAQEMFSLTLSHKPDEDIRQIDPMIQDEVIKKYSDRFLLSQFDDIRKDLGNPSLKMEKADKLYNLVDSLGQLFHLILVSNLSERKVFSVALTDRPDEELYEILDLCERFGYLHKSSIGNKMGTGRNQLYVLSRILAPHFKLDPMSFAGYKFMKSSTLKIALTNQNRFLQMMLKGINRENDGQLSFFDDILDYE